MRQTYANLSKLAKENQLELQDAVHNYQKDEDPISFANIFCKLYPLSLSVCSKFWNLTESDMASFCLEELHNAIHKYDDGQDTKFQTFFATCFRNRLRHETQKLDCDKRKANTKSEDFAAYAEIAQGYYEVGIENAEVHDLLAGIELSENEQQYCQIIMKTPGKITDKEISKIIGVSSAAINYMKKRLKVKLQAVL